MGSLGRATIGIEPGHLLLVADRRIVLRIVVERWREDKASQHLPLVAIEKHVFDVDDGLVANRLFISGFLGRNLSAVVEWTALPHLLLICGPIWPTHILHLHDVLRDNNGRKFTCTQITYLLVQISQGTLDNRRFA